MFEFSSRCFQIIICKIQKDLLDYLIIHDSEGEEERYAENLETALAECFNHFHTLQTTTYYYSHSYWKPGSAYYFHNRPP